MGHTHTPARVTLNDGASTYINVGSWAEEEADAQDPARKAHRAARTHLAEVHRPLLDAFGESAEPDPTLNAERALAHWRSLN